MNEKIVPDVYGTTWWLASLYVPTCEELEISGDGWGVYLSNVLLALDDNDNYCLVRVKETRYEDESDPEKPERYYDWIRLHDGETVDVYYWQFAPVRPSYYTQLHLRNQKEADDGTL